MSPLEDTVRGYCLGDKEINEWIRNGKLEVPSLQATSTQPSSFDPTIGREVFLLETGKKGILKPKKEQTIEQLIKSIPKHLIQKKAIGSGYQLQKGFSYLVPLQEKVILQPGEVIKSSPKSSTGRLFIRTRVLADKNLCIDEAHAQYTSGEEIGLWLLAQPLALNVVVHPNMALTQLRFFDGLDSMLLDQEIRAEHETNPLLYHEKTEEKNVPVRNPLICQGLQAHLDLSGKYSNEIIGFRTKRNQEAIDLQSRGVYNPLDFFEVLKGNGGGELIIKPGDFYLLTGQEIVRIPTTTSAELRSNTHISLDGPLHLAGFFDPGFCARPLYEIRSDETTPITLTHGMPLSRFEFHHNVEPTHPYGHKAVGSTFQGQKGIKLPKPFKPLELADIE